MQSHVRVGTPLENLQFPLQLSTLHDCFFPFWTHLRCPWIRLLSIASILFAESGERLDNELSD